MTTCDVISTRYMLASFVQRIKTEGENTMSKRIINKTRFYYDVEFSVNGYTVRVLRVYIGRKK